MGTVVVKDMSRFERNDRDTGMHTEIMFSDRDVRFIAISNGIDSDSQQAYDFTPLLNIINEMFV